MSQITETAIPKYSIHKTRRGGNSLFELPELNCEHKEALLFLNCVIRL
jgi:hypothetical protein